MSKKNKHARSTQTPSSKVDSWSYTFYLMRKEARDHTTHPARLKHLLVYSQDEEVQKLVVWNPSFPLEEAEKAAKRYPYLLESLGARADLPVNTLNKIVRKTKNDDFVLRNLHNLNLDDKTLHHITKTYTNLAIYKKVANHPSTPTECLRYISNKLAQKMALSPSEVESIAQHPNVPGDVLAVFYKQKLLNKEQMKKIADGDKKVSEWLENFGLSSPNMVLPWEWIFALMDSEAIPNF